MAGLKDDWSPELEQMVRDAAPVGTVVLTLSRSLPNEIVDIGRSGVHVHTQRSRAAGRAQLVPGWMFQLAWDELRREGSLSNGRLLNELKVRRSSAVCAILARLPGARVRRTSPLALLYEREAL